MWRLTALRALLLFVVGCQRFDDEQVRADFLGRHPSYLISAINIGEGDGDTVYVHIRYRTEKGEVEREVEWQYVRRSDGWRLERTEMK